MNLVIFEWSPYTLTLQIGHVLPNLDMLSKTNVLFTRDPLLYSVLRVCLLYISAERLGQIFFIS